jgi:hypothetical protein
MLIDKKLASYTQRKTRLEIHYLFLGWEELGQ